MASAAAGVHPVQQPQPTSHFPEIPPAQEEEMYAATVNATRTEYNTHYAAYKSEVDAIASLVVTWRDRHTEIIAGKVTLDSQQKKAELNEKIDRYIQFRQVREDTKRILGVYQAAIAELEPPPLDIDTLKRFQRLRINISDLLKTPYDQMFTTDLSDLKAKMVLIQEMYQKAVLDLVSLREALEPLAIHVLDYSWASHQGLKVYETSHTPLVKGLVREREKALKQAPVAEE